MKSARRLRDLSKALGASSASPCQQLDLWQWDLCCAAPAVEQKEGKRRVWSRLDSTRTAPRPALAARNASADAIRVQLASPLPHPRLLFYIIALTLMLLRPSEDSVGLF
jgi:hypothetical protein